ncbi:MAG: hypothetical protein JW767_07465 [Thermoleophilia bacterium]|nr:hypothetical protein [Thermoleophilia bacterium]
MPIGDSTRRVTKAAGAATAAAPYVRRAISDEQVRDDLRSAATAVRHLVDEFTGDDRVRRLVTDTGVRRDVDEILEAMQDAGRRVLQPRRQMPWGWIFFWGSLAGAVGAVFAVPQSRAAILRVFDRLRGRTPSETEAVADDAATPLSAAA